MFIVIQDLRRLFHKRILKIKMARRKMLTLKMPRKRKLRRENQGI